MLQIYSYQFRNEAKWSNDEMNLKANPQNRTYKLLIVIFAVIILVFSILPVCNYFRGSTKDYDRFYQTGQSVLSGGDIYVKGGQTFQFMYPPTAAILYALMSMFGLLPMIVIFVIANSALWMVSIFLSVYLTTGKILQQHPLLYLAPTACCIPFVWDIYQLGQPNLLLLVCMLGAFVYLQLKKEWHAGVFIAFAASLKAFPILSLVYLLYRRRWKAALSTVVFLVFFLVVLPIPFRGFQRNLQDLITWNKGMVLHYDTDSIAQRPGRGYSWKNQSLIAVANRLLRPVDAFHSKTRPVYVNLATLEFKYLNVIIIATALGLCLFYITSMPHSAQRTMHTDSIEYAMLLILILIFTPLSFTYFYVWLLYPLMVAVHILLAMPYPSRARNLTLIWFLVCLLLLSFMLPIPGFRWLAAIGSTLYACVLLLGGLGWKLRQL
ncbi:MAG: DUF2029 domain-containing protein [Candidatus Brocadia sp. AMX2]|nr:MULTISPECIES: glycosyltransferase family 87 protein [Brocadia]MBC6930781.1 DUF2029 domain-containing protein [Candidatus Brocadia sp.]MBL1167750.1 DUF2029 domain-containing protein [Candidatus Brocadia sp. AMX1]NOG41363.1 DUF2029 domain-containing protein [Planctomycetota bacterium]KAA0245579.1 MAG: DUF2029 domain-containing protein [Candidatus Brocadia sp. AMX2]MCE7865456.1 DUF2029 domain-containing protein [Candidatus Brocadia sp. AMX2]